MKKGKNREKYQNTMRNEEKSLRSDIKPDDEGWF